MPRIIADFNTLQVDPTKILLGTLGTPNGDQLCGYYTGDLVVLDGGDLEVVASLQFDEAHQAWFAIPDWTTQKELAV